MSRPRDPDPVRSGLHRVHTRGGWTSGGVGAAPPSEEPWPEEPRHADEPIGDVPPGAEPRVGAAHEECYACPVGSVFASVRESEPEALDHLLGAVHELIGLARAMVEVADRVVEAQRGARKSRGGEGRVRRIVVE